VNTHLSKTVWTKLVFVCVTEKREDIPAGDHCLHHW